jgi:hypothetical protein
MFVKAAIRTTEKMMSLRELNRVGEMCHVSGLGLCVMAAPALTMVIVPVPLPYVEGLSARYRFYTPTLILPKDPR